ncbi:MAG: hypothetical protein LBD44_01765 [Spirochaetaceae bacterium]|nr:hypothetical protein [Spirochaetaceae bacterium]
MPKFLAYYIVTDSQYKHGKIRYITGGGEEADFTPVNDPENPVDPPVGEQPPGIDGLIDADKDKDTLAFSYINDQGVPEVLACNVSTPLPASTDTDDPEPLGTGNPLTSTGRYTVIVPHLISGTGIVDWRVLPEDKGRNIRLVVSGADGNTVEVAGNPQAVIKVGENLLILGYDSTVVYRISLETLKTTPNDDDCLAAEAIDLMGGAAGDITIGEYHHGTALLPMYHYNAKTSEEELFVFGLYSNTAEDGEGNVTTQYDSTLVRCKVTSEVNATLVYDASALVGANSTDMDKYTYDGDDYILISAIGGIQAKPGDLTNGGASCVYMVKAFAEEADFDDMTEIIEGDGGDIPQPVTPNGTYDVHYLVVSEDGLNALLGTLTYDEAVRACWRYYRANLAGIVEWVNSGKGNAVNISKLVEEGLLIEVDSGFRDEAGYYWEGAFLNAANQLWTMKGNGIRICSASDYSALIKEINAGNGTLYDSTFNINLLNLIGEMLYQPAAKDRAMRGAPRLGKHRMLALHARAARNTAKARAAAKAAEEAQAAKAGKEK